MRPWRRRGLLAAGFALVATSLTAAPAAAITGASAATTGGAATATEPATVAIQPSIKDLLASRSGPVDTTQCEALFSVACYEPLQIQAAYNEGPLFRRGVTGRDQTIAIIDAFGSPTIAADLAAFDSSFGLPAPPSFRIIQPAGAVPPFDPHNATMIGVGQRDHVGRRVGPRDGSRREHPAGRDARRRDRRDDRVPSDSPGRELCDRPSPGRDHQSELQRHRRDAPPGPRFHDPPAQFVHQCLLPGRHRPGLLR